MKPSVLIITLFTFAAQVIATPVPDSALPAVAIIPKAAALTSRNGLSGSPILPDTHGLSKRGTYTMTFYDDIDYGGGSITISGVTAQCYDLPNGWNDRASSAKHSQPHVCSWWKNAGCSGIVCGGNQNNVPSFGAFGLNDAISSYKCY